METQSLRIWKSCKAWIKVNLVLEDVSPLIYIPHAYMIGFIIIGFLLFGVGGFLMYRKILKMLSAIYAIVGCLARTRECVALSTQTPVSKTKLEEVVSLARFEFGCLEVLPGPDRL